jgi:tripartite-type tricarboxylate transporter receptor subunit TctC
MKTQVLAAAAAMCAAHAAAVEAQTAAYPAKPVRIVVPLAPGGNVDLVVRSIAPQLAENLGQQVIVDNRPGASSLVGTQLVSKSAPDGYTLLAMANTFAMVPSILANPGYDPLRDFTGVTLTCLVPQVLVVNPALPVRSVKELIALAKSRPGEITYATSGAGATGHMAAELFSRQVGVKMLHVPYKGNSQAIVDVIGGQVMMMFDQVSTSVPYIKAGKLRGIAVSSRTRSPLFPNLPTIDEAGVPGFEDITFNGLAAPAGTPREILVRLNEEVAKVVRAPALRDRFLERGVELKASASPEEFTAHIKTEYDKKSKLARDAGIRIE